MSRTVNIRGKEYVTVAGRVNDFRERHTIRDGWAIRTEIHSLDEEVVVVRAEIVDPGDRVVAVGYAEERRSSSQINKTSALENCETSAIGRALAACGFGGTEYASANEVETAIAQQESERAKTEAKRWTANERKAFCAKLTDLDISYDDVAAWCESLGRPRPSTMTPDQRASVLGVLSDPNKVGRFLAWRDEVTHG